jgi:hypothetical protein
VILLFMVLWVCTFFTPSSALVFLVFLFSPIEGLPSVVQIKRYLMLILSIPAIDKRGY